MIYTSILILILLYFDIIGYRYSKNIVNPVFSFNFIWTICFVLLIAGFSKYYSNEISRKAFFVFLAMILSFNLSYFSRICIKRNKSIICLNLIKAKSKYKFICYLFYIWIICILLETIYCGNFPLIWLILGENGNYASFGIPSIHGFINSLSWFVLNISFIYFLDEHDKRVLNIIVIINIFYIFLLARQSFTTEAIQLTCIFALKRNVKLKKIFAIALFGIFLFGIIGNIRTNYKHILSTSGLMYNDFPYLLMGFIWVYLYLMTPIANAAHFFDLYKEFQYGTSSLRGFLPSILTGSLNLPTIDFNDFLISKTYNVSTSLIQPYSDFGIIGICLFFAFLGRLGARYWKSLQKDNYSDIDICNYSIYCGILALTFFSNMLLSLPIVIQFLYTNLLFRNHFSVKNIFD